MNVNDIKISGDNFEVTEALSALIHKKFGRLLKHYVRFINSIEILLKIDHRERQIAEANILVHDKQLHATAATEDMYQSIDDLIGKLDHQLKKYKANHLHHKE